MQENPKLLSPDYTFVGDKIERYNNRKQLEEKGLKWYTVNDMNSQKIENTKELFYKNIGKDEKILKEKNEVIKKFKSD